MIPESFKQELLSRVDIVDVVDTRVPLKKAGANFSACCPFHTEKTPSFMVSPSRQTYHCFGCGVHGNAIGFLMEYAGLGYVDALRDLAESVGMKLPPIEAAGKRVEPPPPDLFDRMARAARFYKESLKASPRAIDYLKGRGLSGEIAARFGIGYAPDGWQSLQRIFADYDAKALVDCGLVIQNDEGRRYDRFRDRIMFPITNQRGDVIGFGGRVLGKGEPKYLNSPETPLFEKGRELYGLREARESIRKEDRVVVVEGYMDVVALAQYGVPNVVATLGTATTPMHLTKLMRQTSEIVFCFDGDAAGRKAAWHALEVTLATVPDGKLARFLFLPPEDDPDSYVRANGAAAFNRLAGAAEPLSAYLVAELIRRNDVSTAEGRSRLVAEAKPLLQKMVAPALQLQLLGEVAAAASMTAADVSRLYGLDGGRADRSGRRAASAAEGSPEASAAFGGRSAQRRPAVSDGRLERELLRSVMAYPDLACDVPIELLVSGRPAADALIAVIDFVSEHDAGLPAVADRFRGTPHESIVRAAMADLAAVPLAREAAAVELRGAVMQLEILQLQNQRKSLNEKAELGALSEADKALYRDLTRREHALKEARRGAGSVI